MATPISQDRDDKKGRRGRGVLGKAGGFLKKATTPLLLGLGAFDVARTLGDDELSASEKGEEVTSTAGGVGGALAGMKAGVTLGALAGPLGSAAGGLVGSGLGYLAGSGLGRFAGRMLFGNKDEQHPREQQIQDQDLAQSASTVSNEQIERLEKITGFSPQVKILKNNLIEFESTFNDLRLKNQNLIQISRLIENLAEQLDQNSKLYESLKHLERSFSRLEINTDQFDNLYQSQQRLENSFNRLEINTPLQRLENSFSRLEINTDQFDKLSNTTKEISNSIIDFGLTLLDSISKTNKFDISTIQLENVFDSLTLATNSVSNLTNVIKDAGQNLDKLSLEKFNRFITNASQTQIELHNLRSPTKGFEKLQTILNKNIFARFIKDAKIANKQILKISNAERQITNIGLPNLNSLEEITNLLEKVHYLKNSVNELNQDFGSLNNNTQTIDNLTNSISGFEQTLNNIDFNTLAIDNANNSLEEIVKKLEKINDQLQNKDEEFFEKFTKINEPQTGNLLTSIGSDRNEKLEDVNRTLVDILGVLMRTHDIDRRQLNATRAMTNNLY